MTEIWFFCTSRPLFENKTFFLKTLNADWVSVRDPPFRSISLVWSTPDNGGALLQGKIFQHFFPGYLLYMQLAKPATGKLNCNWRFCRAVLCCIFYYSMTPSSIYIQRARCADRRDYIVPALESIVKTRHQKHDPLSRGPWPIRGRPDRDPLSPTSTHILINDCRRVGGILPATSKLWPFVYILVPLNLPKHIKINGTRPREV